jgi:hypothetical protein
VFGFWKTVYQPTVKPKQPLLDDESLLEVFESTSEASDAKQIRFRYLLTLVLIRRRLLRVVGTKTREGGRVMQVLRRGEPDAVPMEVVDPAMDELSVADAMETLAPLIDPDAAGGEGANVAAAASGAAPASQVEAKSSAGERARTE